MQGEKAARGFVCYPRGRLLACCLRLTPSASWFTVKRKLKSSLLSLTGHCRAHPGDVLEVGGTLCRCSSQSFQQLLHHKVAKVLWIPVWPRPVWLFLINSHLNLHMGSTEAVNQPWVYIRRFRKSNRPLCVSVMLTNPLNHHFSAQAQSVSPSVLLLLTFTRSVLCAVSDCMHTQTTSH